MLQGLSSDPNIILRYGTTLCPKRVLYPAILSSRFLIAANNHRCGGEFIYAQDVFIHADGSLSAIIQLAQYNAGQENSNGLAQEFPNYFLLSKESNDDIGIQ